MKTKHTLIAVFLVVALALAVSSCSARENVADEPSSTTKIESTTSNNEEINTTKDTSTSVSINKKDIVVDGDYSTTSKRGLEDLPEDIREDIINNQEASSTTSNHSKATTTTKKKDVLTTKSTTQKTTTNKSTKPYEAPTVALD